MADWRTYLGLPHRFRADPAEGRGADCLLLVMGLLDELGFAHPPVEAAWFDLAERGAWSQLEALWQRHTTPLPGPETGAVTLIHNGCAGLGVAVVIEGGLLLVHHRRGVTWVPLHLLKPLSYVRFCP